MTKGLTYLDAAAIILKDSNRPLSANEIAAEIQHRRLINIRGKTPWRTVNARLSVDIKEHGESSRFKRTKPGVYTLRRLPGDEFHTKPREKTIDPATTVLVFPVELLNSLGHFHGINKDYTRYSRALLNQENSFFMPRLKAEENADYKQIVSYSIVQHNDSLLRFTRGKFSTIGQYLHGQYSVGFGGHIEGTDWTLFNLSDLGHTASLERELEEEIGVSFSISAPGVFQIVGVLNDDSSWLGRHHFAFISKIQVPTKEFEKGTHFDKGELSINKPELVSIPSLATDFAEYEYWSKLCIQTFYGDRLTFSCHVQPRSDFKLRDQANIILIVGYIGSGKTEACRLLVQEFDYTLVPCSRIMQELIGCGPIESIGRRQLQDLGYQFIHKENGHERLATGIVNFVKEHNPSRFVLDGLRYPETLEVVQKLLGVPITIIFVETIIDNLFAYYKAREDDNCSFSEFLTLISHPVEREIERYVSLANIIAYNHGSKNSYIDKLREFFKEELD